MNSRDMMNYTRGTYFSSFCEHIAHNYNDAKCDKNIWISEIDSIAHQIQKRSEGFWGTTRSDNVFMKYMSRLKTALEKNVSSEDIVKLRTEAKKHTCDKLRLLFLTQDVQCWSSLESVFFAALADERFEADLVYTHYNVQISPDAPDYYDIYKTELNLPVIRHDEYSIAEHSPDVMFINKGYDNVPPEFFTRELDRTIPRMLYISYGMEITTDLTNFLFQTYMHYKAWRHIAYGDIVRKYAAKGGFRNGDNIAIWGHPKADSYLDINQSRNLVPKEWLDKINGRQVILWTPHHIVGTNEMTRYEGTSTFLMWKDTMLDAAKRNRNLVFIFRPHPLLRAGILKSGLITEDDFDNYLDDLISQENVINDTNLDYRFAFYASDAIITDGTAFSVEFLYTDRPLMLTPRNIDGFYLKDEMLECYYIGSTADDIIKFILMVADNRDYLKQKRLDFKQKHLYVPQGKTVGQNILDKMFDELIKEETY